MLAVHTILHPTDFSEQSQYALALAGGLARDYGARLIALHVVPVPAIVYGEGIVPPNPTELRAEAQRQLDQLPDPYPDIHMERRLAEGDAVEEILRAAHQTNADLIVMGTHGRTGLGRLLMGSAAEQVVRRAECPVLTVKAPFPASSAIGAPRGQGNPGRDRDRLTQMGWWLERLPKSPRLRKSDVGGCPLAGPIHMIIPSKDQSP